MEKHTFLIKKEVFETSSYSDITDCAMSTTIRERLHPDRVVCTGYDDVDVCFENHVTGEFGYEFSYIVSERDVKKVRAAYNNPRDIRVTFKRVR